MKDDLKNIQLLLENIEQGFKDLARTLTKDNPTPQQRMNRLKFKRWWRSFKREGELMLPFILGIVLIGLTAYITITSNL